MTLTPNSVQNSGWADIHGDEFASEKSTGGNGFVEIKQFAKYSGCDTVLRDSLDILGGITPYRLGKLLGMSQPNNVSSLWLAGRNRPSQLYTIRLLKLHQMVLAGVSLILIDSIDWERGAIRFRSLPRRRGDSGAHQAAISIARRQIQDGVGQHRDPLGEFFNQPPGFGSPRPG